MLLLVQHITKMQCAAAKQIIITLHYMKMTAICQTAINKDILIRKQSNEQTMLGVTQVTDTRQEYYTTSCRQRCYTLAFPCCQIPVNISSEPLADS